MNIPKLTDIVTSMSTITNSRMLYSIPFPKMEDIMDTSDSSEIESNI